MNAIQKRKDSSVRLPILREPPSMDVWYRARAEEAREAEKAAVEEALRNPQPGDLLPDGSVYVGISPDTGLPMAAMPVDEEGRVSWYSALERAVEKNALGHQDWRVPTAKELNLLYQNKDVGELKDTFNESGSNSGSSWYRSSSEADDYGSIDQCFSDGKQNFNIRSYDGSSVRFVRTVEI